MSDSKTGISRYNNASKRLDITLPFAALSVNSLYRFWRGRFLLSARGRKFHAAVMAILGPINVAYDEPVDVFIDAWYMNRSKWDIDNISKMLLDCLSTPRPSVLTCNGPLESGLPLIADDCQIYSLMLIKHDYDESKPEGEVWITIKPIGR